jgi:hypothetical protein
MTQAAAWQTTAAPVHTLARALPIRLPMMGARGRVTQSSTRRLERFRAERLAFDLVFPASSYQWKEAVNPAQALENPVFMLRQDGKPVCIELPRVSAYLNRRRSKTEIPHRSPCSRSQSGRASCGLSIVVVPDIPHEYPVALVVRAVLQFLDRLSYGTWSSLRMCSPCLLIGPRTSLA